MKLILFIKSLKFYNLNLNHEIVVIGPNGSDLLKKFFLKNFFYISIFNSIPINFILIPNAIKYFFKILFTNPIFFFKRYKIIFFLSFTLSFIEKKKIKKLICFDLYNILPNYLEIFYNKKIKIIKIQNGVGIEHKFQNKNHFHFVFSKKDIIHKKNTYLMANLKLLLYLYLNEQNKNYLLSEKNEIKNITIVSSANYDSIKFLHEKIKNKKKILLDTLPKLKTKGLDIEKDWLKLRAINFVMLCLYINEFLKVSKIKCNILLRSKSKSDLKIEKEFFRKIIYNCKFIKNHERYKYNYIINSKKTLFVSDNSTFGFEIFSLNKKSLFFSWCFHDRKNFHQMPKNSLLYFKSRSINKFKARIKKLFVLSNKGFINEKKKKFKDNSMIFPKLDQLDFFLKISGLEIK